MLQSKYKSGTTHSLTHYKIPHPAPRPPDVFLNALTKSDWTKEDISNQSSKAKWNEGGKLRAASKDISTEITNFVSIMQGALVSSQANSTLHCALPFHPVGFCIGATGRGLGKEEWERV